jgi:putative transposase
VEVCKNIEGRFEVHFLEIGADENHVHFLIQSVPMMSAKSIVQVVKSITARELFPSSSRSETAVVGRTILE